MEQYAGVLKCFTRFFVQNEESKRLLESIGITAVDVVGDTRFDRVLQIKEAAKQLPICDAFRKRQATEDSAAGEIPAKEAERSGNNCVFLQPGRPFQQPETAP